MVCPGYTTEEAAKKIKSGDTNHHDFSILLQKKF